MTWAPSFGPTRSARQSPSGRSSAPARAIGATTIAAWTSNATHNLAGYASLGGQLGYKRVGLRIEARDYATGFKPLAVAGTSDRRNDVAVLVGLSYKR